MASIEITRADLGKLAESLDGFNMPIEEMELLSALVTKAASALTQDPSEPLRVEDPVPTFQEQFAALFSPAIESGTVLTIRKTNRTDHS